MDREKRQTIARHLLPWQKEKRDKKSRPNPLAPDATTTKPQYFLLNFFKVVFKESMRDLIPIRAASLTYATMLTLVPILIIVFNLFQLFGGADWFTDNVRPFLLNNLAPGTGDAVANRLEELIVNAGGALLNSIGVVLLILAVWSIFSGIEGTINAIWGTRSAAGSLKRVPLYWGLITIIPILLVGSLALSTYIQTFPIISATVEQIGFLQTFFNRAVSAGMIVLGLFLLYMYVPNTAVRARFALASGIVAGLLYEILKSGFIFYTTNLVQYNVIYGSLAAILLLFIWVNLSWILVLAGVEMTFVMQHYNVLASRSKSLRLSKMQRNALGYLFLYEATQAFRDKGETGGRINPVLYAEDWGLPPGLSESLIDKLQEGGLVERVGNPPEDIILARSPKLITVSEIDALLMSERRREWEWPDARPWLWLKGWLERRQLASLKGSGIETLNELVTEMERTMPQVDLSTSTHDETKDVKNQSKTLEGEQSHPTAVNDSESHHK